MARSQAALAWTVLAPLFAAGAGGQELITDRPDQTESAALVPVDGLQVELGALWGRDAAGGERTDRFEAPGVLVRYGLGERLELRVAWSGRSEEEMRNGGGEVKRRSGFGDPEIGFKLALAAESGGRPELALLAHLSLPVGEHEFGAPRADPALRLTAAHTLSERLGLGWNLGYELASFEDGRGETHTSGRFIYTAALGLALSERWGAFVELYGDLPASDPAPAAHSFDAGVTFLLTPRVQLDAAAGVGLNGAAPDRFVGVGLSFRLPH